MGRRAKGGRAGVEVEGGPELRRALRHFDERLDDLTAIHADVGELVADTAEDIVPRLRGTLGETIKPHRTKRGANVTAGGRRAVYGPPIHFGWRARNIEPQPFLYDALDQRRGDVLRRYDDGVGDLVRKFDREAPD